MKLLVTLAAFVAVAVAGPMHYDDSQLQAIINAINSPHTDPATAGLLQDQLDAVLDSIKPSPVDVGPAIVEGEPISVGPAVIDGYEPISVGPAVIDEYEPISVGPAVIDEYEPISVGPAVIDEYEPISVGPAIVDEYEPISIGPALIDGPVPDPAAISSSPLVQVIVNINTPQAAKPKPVEDITTGPAMIDFDLSPIKPDPVIVVEAPEPQPIQPEPVHIGEAFLPTPALPIPENH